MPRQIRIEFGVAEAWAWLKNTGMRRSKHWSGNLLRGPAKGFHRKLKRG
jgi:hypothetical protein